MMASFNLSVSFSLLLYEGSSRVLKQVCDVGSLLLSVPSLWMMQRKLPKPPIGALSLPVKNLRNLRFSSSSITSLTTSHSHLTTCERNHCFRPLVSLHSCFAMVPHMLQMMLVANTFRSISCFAAMHSLCILCAIASTVVCCHGAEAIHLYGRNDKPARNRGLTLCSGL